MPTARERNAVDFKARRAAYLKRHRAPATKTTTTHAERVAARRVRAFRAALKIQKTKESKT